MWIVGFCADRHELCYLPLCYSNFILVMRANVLINKVPYFAFCILYYRYDSRVIENWNSDTVDESVLYFVIKILSKSNSWAVHLHAASNADFSSTSLCYLVLWPQSWINSTTTTTCSGEDSCNEAMAALQDAAHQST